MEASHLHSKKDIIIDPDLECSVCNDILFKPVSLNCGHTYCKECLITILNMKPQCPLCRTPCFLQENNLKENVTLKTVIENKYPDYIREKHSGRVNSSQTEERRQETQSIRESQQQPFNPLVILPLSDSLDKIIFPGSEEVITIRINYDPIILQNVCNDKKFLALPDQPVQERLQVVTCIYEFLDLQPIKNSKELYKAKIKVCERVLVNNYSDLDLDKQVLEGWGIQDNDRVISLKIGKGFLLKDSNTASITQLENQVAEIEEFLNDKLNHWISAAPPNAQFVINQTSHMMQQERSLEYIINFSFMMARLLKCSTEEKKRMFETTNTFERLLVLKHITDRLSHSVEFGMIIDAEIPGTKIFGNLKSAILVLIGLVLFLIFSRK